MSSEDDLSLENMLKDKGSRKVIMDHLHYCRVFENIFNKDNSQLSYNAGLRAGGLRLMDRIKEVSPHLYLKMIEEDTHG